MNTVTEKILQQRLIAVLRLDDLQHALALSNALGDAGVRVQEFTLSNPDALEAIRITREKGSTEMLIGAGSVCTLEQCKQSIAAGAQFIVSPILDTNIVAYCLQQNCVYLPGAFSPTEVFTATAAGAPFVKVFPANRLGPGYIKDLLAPMPDLSLVPTGGIDINNLADYLRAGVKAVGVGSALIDGRALQKQDWQGVSDHAHTYVQRVAEVN